LRVDIQANVAVKTQDGVLTFNSLDWLEGRVLQIQGESHLTRGQTCELRLELTGTSESVYAEADVLSVVDSDTPSAVCRIRRMSARDSERFRDWVDEVSRSTTSRRGDRSARSTPKQRPRPQHSDPSVHSRPTRSSVRPSRWLDSVTAGRRSVADESATDTVLSRNVSGREALRVALRRSLRERRAEARADAPPEEPRVELTPDGRVTATWTDPEALRSDVQRQLLAGHLRLKVTPTTPRFTLRLALPDGQVLAVPATAEPHPAGGCIARFRVGLPLKQKLKRATAA
jgi:hypothetical protein